VGGLREIAAPFVVAVPSGARVRTRLRVSAADAAVLRAAGRHLGSLASADLAARCREGQDKLLLSQLGTVTLCQ
jgi:hypothetical protein